MKLRNEEKEVSYTVKNRRKGKILNTFEHKIHTIAG